MKKQFVEGFESGAQVEDVFLAFEKDFRQAKNGSNYISLVLGDRSGKIHARKWDATRDEFDWWSTSGFLLVRGRVETYKGKLQLIVKSASPFDGKNADIEEFLPRAKVPAEKMLAELKTLLKGIKSPEILALVDSLLEDRAFIEKFAKAPAGIKLHHAYISGLLEHTLAMARTASLICGIYPDVDRDLLLAGVLLHDAGKIEEMANVPQIVYTDRGYLLGHIFIGARLAADRMDAIPGFSMELKSRIVHMVLSHHGEHGFGSPVLPMTLEALLLHHIDNIDAKTKIFLDSAEKAREEGLSWTDWLNHMERRFFVGGQESGGIPNGPAL